MANVYNKNRAKPGKKAAWYARFRDATGRWVDRSTRARTKAEAQRIAAQWQRTAWQIQQGLELPKADGSWTVDDLMTWWLEHYQKKTASYGRTRSAVRKHIIGSTLGRVQLKRVTHGQVEALLCAKDKSLSARTVNHLRGFLETAFNTAIDAEVYRGANPIARVKRRKTAAPRHDYLRSHEVSPLLDALAPRWRHLFAAAIYAGLRKGELLALRKEDVDLAAGHIVVRRSHHREQTKNRKAQVVPIHDQLRPHLLAAIDASPSPWVFPRPDGSQMRVDHNLVGILRSAMRLAGIVERYEHVCRRKGCGHVETDQGDRLRPCPACSMKLWPRAIVRKIRFHDLRHTCATLLLQSGADLHAVSKIMRHSDVRITLEVYGHLAPDYLRRELDKLSIPAGSGLAGPVTTGWPPPGFAADLLHDGGQAKRRGRDPCDKRPESRPFTWLRGQDLNL